MSEKSAVHIANHLPKRSLPPYPPPNPFNYPVPYSNIALEFAVYSTLSDCNQTEVSIIMRDAIRDSINPFRPQDAMPLTYRFWTSGRYWLDMRPIGTSVSFTHGMWTASLTGINNFVLAYPGLFFLYRVFLNDETSDMGICLAIGGLEFS